MAKVSKRARIAYVTVAALSSTFMSSAAWADCVNQGPVHPEQVVCGPPGTQGYNGAATNGLAITVQGNTSVQTNVGGPALISAGTGSSLINFSGSFNNNVGSTYGIDAGSQSAPAISVGGGSAITNGSDAHMRGAVSFGSATGSAVNILNNNYSHSGATNLIGVIEGDVISSGNTTINNQGLIGDNAGAHGSITQTGAGTVVINNGLSGGYASPVAGGFTGVQNGLIYNPGGTAISTQGSTTLTNFGTSTAGPPPTPGAIIYGDVTLGTLGLGSSSITNGSQADGPATIIGNVTMGDHNNTVTNDGIITGNVTMNGTGTNTYNAGSSGSSGDNGLRLPGAAVGVGAVPTGVVAGTLQGNGSNSTLNLNGTGTSFLQPGSDIEDFGTVNKNDSGAWILGNTLDGDSGSLTTINVNDGNLEAQNAGFLGSANTTVKLANSATLTFTGSFTGEFDGNIVDATGASSGQVLVIGGNVTTLGGNNTYHAATTIDGGKLATASDTALSANSDFTIQNGGTLTINNANTIKSLSDGGSGPNTVELNGGDTSLTLGSGSWGASGGTITGNGSLIKTSTGTLTLGGTSAVNLTGGTFFINDGIVNVNATNAIGVTTVVQMNPGSNPVTAPVLNINQDDAIGGLGGFAGSTVNIASGKTLTSGADVSIARFDGNIKGLGALKATGGIMFLNGVNSYSGGTTVTGGAQLLGWAGPSGNSLQGDIAADAGTIVEFNQANTPSGSISGTYAGKLSGLGAVNFKGDSTTLLTLSGDNSGLTGSMNFLSGTVAISATNNVGVGILTFNGGTLRNTANVTLANLITLSGPGTFLTDPSTTLTLNGIISGGGGLTKTGAGTLVLGGANSYTGGTTVSAGTLQGAGGVGLQGNIVNNAAVRFAPGGAYAGNMSGSGTVEIAGSTTFSGTNTYSGDTTVDNGFTLTAGLNNLSANSGHVVNGALTLTGNNTIKNLGGGTTGVVNLGTSTLTLANIGSYSYGGQLNGAGTGSLVVGNGGGTWTFASTGTTGTALLAFTNNGNTILNGSLAAATGINGTTGVLSGNGTFTGNFTNNGTIRPGSSPGVLHFVGTYAQGGTGNYVIDINANNSSSVVAGTDYDQIAVTGTPATANLAGGAVINQNGGEFVNGTVYHILTTTASTTGVTDGLITGNFTFTGNNNRISSFITLTPTITNNALTHGATYDLTVVRSNYSTVANNPNQAAVAGLSSSSGLQGLVGVGNAASAVARIDNMSDGDARSFFDQISPEAYGAYVSALQDQGNLFTRQVAHRLARTTGDKDAKMGVWGNLYGQWGNGKNNSFRFGSKQDIKGGALGVDGSLGESLTLGVAGGYSEDTVKYRLGNSKGKSKSWQFGGYASYHPGKLAADVQVAYIHGKVNAGKSVAVGSGFSATSGVATAHTSGNLFKAVGTVGYEVGSETLSFKPFVGVDFTTGHLNSFNEHGTLGALLLSVGKQKADRTDLLAGFKFAPNMGSLTPYADATLRYGLSRNHGLVHAAFDGLSSDVFTVSAQRAGRMQGELDAGLAYAIGKSSSIFFGYAGTLRKSLTEHGVNGGVKFAF